MRGFHLREQRSSLEHGSIFVLLDPSQDAMGHTNL